jgi:Cu-Zn family superoxide dismutase
VHSIRPAQALAAAAALVLAGCASLDLGLGGGEGDSDGLGPDATATLRAPDGRVVGQVDLRDTPHDATILRVTVSGGVIEAGTHGFHIHEVGRCDPDFGAAGGHYAPRGHAHGLLHPDGMHAGDLPNLHVERTGRTEFEILAQGVTTRAGATGTLFDADGSAFIMHANPDDYRSQPSGAAGDRVACGVIQRR